jgi:hypothetical protein
MEDVAADTAVGPTRRAFTWAERDCTAQSLACKSRSRPWRLRRLVRCSHRPEDYRLPSTGCNRRERPAKQALPLASAHAPRSSHQNDAVALAAPAAPL